MANATPQEIAAIYQNVLGRTNVDAEGLAYWSSHPLSDLVGTAEGITGNKVDTTTLKPSGTPSGTAAVGADQARANAAAVDPGYSTAGYQQGYTSQAATPSTATQDPSLWDTKPVSQVANTTTTDTGKIPKSVLDYMHSLNAKIREAQIKEHGANSPETFQITPAPGKTVLSEMAKWNKLDPTIDPAYAQMFNDANGWFMKGNENLPMDSDGTQMVPGSKWIKTPDAALRLTQSFTDQMTQDAKSSAFVSTLKKAAPLLAIAAAVMATGPAGAGWWGAAGESAAQATALGMLENGTGSIAEIAAQSGLSTAQVSSLANSVSSAGGVSGLASGIADAVAKTGASASQVLSGLSAGYTAAQIAAMGGAAVGVLGALGVGNKEGSTTSTTVPWSAQQPFLTDMFGKAQTLSNQPALTPEQTALQNQANAVQQSVLNQDASKAFGIQKPTDMAAARANTTGGTNLPNTQLGGQVTQDAYANFFRSNSQDPVASSIWQMYANDPVAKQYNPNGPDQNAINFWTQKIQQNGADAAKNEFTGMVQQVASTQPPPDQTRASTMNGVPDGATAVRSADGAPGTASSTGYSQTLADNNTNPYLNASTTVGTIDPLAKNSYLGAKNDYAGLNNPYLTSMINYSNQDIKNAWLPETQRLQRQMGAFGNTGIQQQQDKALTDALQKNSDTLRFQDYTNQQNISAADLARNAALQQTINQGNSSIQAQNVANSTQAQQADLARNAEIWNAGANRDQQAYQFALNQQLGTATGTAGNIAQQQQNLWNPITQYGKAITGSYGGSTTTPTTTNPLISGLSGAALGYNLFSGGK